MLRNNRYNWVLMHRGGITLNKLPLADLAALETALKNQILQNPEIGLHLYADQDVVYSKVAEMMAL
jgi:biopolymer transport protein TolR